MNKCDNTNFWFLVSYIAGQQQHFRPFFDTRFTGHLLELRRKSDPFTMAGANPQGKKTSYLFETIIELLWKLYASISMNNNISCEVYHFL